VYSCGPPCHQIARQKEQLQAAQDKAYQSELAAQELRDTVEHLKEEADHHEGK